MQFKVFSYAVKILHYYLFMSIEHKTKLGSFFKLLRFSPKFFMQLWASSSKKSIKFACWVRIFSFIVVVLHSCMLLICKMNYNTFLYEMKFVWNLYFPRGETYFWMMHWCCTWQLVKWWIYVHKRKILMKNYYESVIQLASHLKTKIFVKKFSFIISVEFVVPFSSPIHE